MQSKMKKKTSQREENVNGLKTRYREELKLEPTMPCFRNLTVRSTPAKNFLRMDMESFHELLVGVEPKTR